MQSFYVSKSPRLKAPSRGRAGLRFDSGYVKVEVVEATDEEIAAKQRAGAYVVNAHGRDAILDDAGATGGLIVTSEPPPTAPPPAPALAPPAASTPTSWRDVAARLDLVTPTIRLLAEPMVRAALERMAANGSPSPSPLVRRFRELLLAEQIDDEYHRLGIALGLVPGADAPLPALGRRHWSTNETAPSWIQLIAAGVGQAFEAYLYPDAAETDATERATSAARKQLDTEAKHTEEAIAARVQADADLRDIGNRRRATANSWSESMDLVRLRVLIAVDNAIKTAPTPIARFALGELGRDGRGMPISRALDDLQYLELAMAEGATLAPVSDAEVLAALPSKTVRLSVVCKGGLKRRSRGGIMFGQTLQSIEVDEGTAALILNDDGLVAFREEHASDPAVHEKLSKAITAHSTQAIEAEIERRRAKPRQQGEARISGRRAP